MTVFRTDYPIDSLRKFETTENREDAMVREHNTAKQKVNVAFS